MCNSSAEGLAGGTRSSTKTVVVHYPQQTVSFSIRRSPRLFFVLSLSLSIPAVAVPVMVIVRFNTEETREDGVPGNRHAGFFHTLVVKKVCATCVPVCNRSAEGLAGGTRSSTNALTGEFRFFVFPLCGFSLSLFCNYCFFRGPCGSVVVLFPVSDCHSLCPVPVTLRLLTMPIRRCCSPSMPIRRDTVETVEHCCHPHESWTCLAAAHFAKFATYINELHTQNLF